MGQDEADAHTSDATGAARESADTLGPLRTPVQTPNSPGGEIEDDENSPGLGTMITSFRRSFAGFVETFTNRSGEASDRPAGASSHVQEAGQQAMQDGQTVQQVQADQQQMQGEGQQSDRAMRSSPAASPKVVGELAAWSNEDKDLTV